MQKITSILNNQQGSVIIIAVIILALLTVIGIAATNTSTTEMQISTNAVLHNVALYTADSGIEAGRAALNNIKIADVGSWDNLLFNIDAADDDKVSILVNDVACAPDPCYTLNDIIDADGGRTVGPATYTLTVVDNNDLDGNDEVDSDNTVFLTSELVSPYRNATATISTTVRGKGDAYPQELYNARNTGEAGAESETASTNMRW
jgi:type IV pilus assembly protein PilX